MNNTDHKEYEALRRRLRNTADAKIGKWFPHDNPNKDLLNEAADKLLEFRILIDDLEKQLNVANAAYYGYPIEDLVIFAQLMRQQHIEVKDLRRFINTADMAARAGFDYALYNARDEIERFTERLKRTTMRYASDIPHIPELTQDIEEVNN